MAGSVKRLFDNSTYSTLQAAYVAIGTLVRDETLEIDTLLGEDVGRFWTNGAFENITNYRLNIVAKSGQVGILDGLGTGNSIFLESINNVYLENLVCKNGNIANLRIKNCHSISAKGLSLESGNWNVFIEGSYGVYLQGVVGTGATSAFISANSCTGLTVNGAEFTPATSVSVMPVGIGITNCSYLDFIAVTSTSAKLDNHYKFEGGTKLTLDRNYLTNCRGSAIYCNNVEEIKLYNSLLWGNGAVTDATAGLFVQRGGDVYLRGNTIKHLCQPSGQCVFLRDNTKQLKENYNNIYLLEKITAGTSVSFFLRLELDPTVSSVSNISSDFNLYYSSIAESKFSGGSIGGLLYTSNSLTSWKSTFSKDLSSIQSAPTFDTGTFVLSSGSRGVAEGSITYTLGLTQDLEVRPSTPDIGAYDRNSTPYVPANIVPSFKAIDLVTKIEYAAPFTIAAYNDVLFIADLSGLPDLLQWNVEGLNSHDTYGLSRYKIAIWTQTTGFPLLFDVSLTASKTGFANSTTLINDFVTVIRRYPVPKFRVVDENLIYVGETVIIDNLTIEGDTFLWTLKSSIGATITTQTTTDFTYLFPSEGNFTLELRATNTSGVRTKELKNIVQVTTAAKYPKVRFTQNKEVVRKGSTVQFTSATPSASSHSWVFFGGTPSTSTEANPLVTYDTLGDFDVVYTATVATKKITTFHKRKVVVARPLTTVGTIHNVVLAGGTVQINNTIASVPVVAGDIIKVSGAADRLILNLIGTDPTNPVIVTNDGLVELTTVTGFYALRGQGCIGVVVDGFGDPLVPYGFKCSQDPSNRNASGVVNFGSRSTDCEIMGVEVFSGRFAGIMFKTDDAGTPRSAFTQKNTRLHHNYIHDVDGEAHYIGHFTWGVDNGVASGYLAPELWDTKIFRNKVVTCGNDGIQLGCGRYGSEIHDNDIQDAGFLGTGSQNSCLSINTGFEGHVYNNRCIPAPKGGSIVAQPTGNCYIYGNTFSGISAGIDGVYIISDVTTNPNIEVLVFNNTVLSKKAGVTYNHRAGNKIGKLIIVNNIFTKGSASLFVQYFGTTALANYLIDKNIVKDFGQQEDVLFFDEENGDLRVGVDSSADLFDGYDLSSIYTSPWTYLTDQRGLVIPSIQGYGYGAALLPTENSFTPPTDLIESIYYKIRCTKVGDLEQWQYGTSLDEAIDTSVAPEDNTFTTIPTTCVIIKDVRRKPAPSNKYTLGVGYVGEVREDSNYVHICRAVTPDNIGIWVTVDKTGETPPVIWDNVIGIPLSSPEQIDNAVLNSSLFMSRPTNDTGLVDKSTPIYDLLSGEWKPAPYGTIGDKVADMTGILTGMIPVYSSVLNKFIAANPTGGFSQASGTLLSFNSAKIYNTLDSPATGNITFDLTGAVIGTTLIVFHKHTSAPTYPIVAKVLSNSESYDTSGSFVNKIEFQYINDVNIQYKISKVVAGALPDPVLLLDGLALYFDADDMSQSTLVSSAVQVWDSPTGTTLPDGTAPATINRPTYDAVGGGNNKPRLIFTSAGTSALYVTGNHINFGALNFWIVFKFPSTSPDDWVFSQSTTAGNGTRFGVYVSGSNILTVYIGSTQITMPAIDNNWNVLKITHIGSACVAKLNNSTPVTATRALTGYAADASTSIGAFRAIADGALTKHSNVEIGKIIVTNIDNTGTLASNVDENLRLEYNLY